MKDGKPTLLSSGVIVTGLLTLLSLPTPAGTLKRTVAVRSFENKTTFMSEGQFVLGDGLADQLTDSLVKSERFVVLDRMTTEDILAEQKMADGGQLAGAQVLVTGTITEFSYARKKQGGGFGFGGLKIGGKKQEGHVGVIIRLIDTTTGSVIDSQRVEAKAKGKGASVDFDSGAVSLGAESFTETPLGTALQEALDEAVRFITSRMEQVPYEGRVVRVNDDELVISAGRRDGATVGDVFTIYSVGEQFIDPVTGEVLGTEEIAIGQIEVVEVAEKYSKAHGSADVLLNVTAGNTIRGGTP